MNSKCFSVLSPQAGMGPSSESGANLQNIATPFVGISFPTKQEQILVNLYFPGKLKESDNQTAARSSCNSPPQEGV